MFLHFMRSALSVLLITSIITSSIAPSYAVRSENLAPNHNSVVIIPPSLSLQNGESEEQEQNNRLGQLGTALSSQHNGDIPQIILSNLNDDDHKNMRLVSKAWKKALEIFEQQHGIFHAIPDDLIGFLRPTCRYAHVVVDRGILDADMIRRIKWGMRSLEVMVKDHDAVEALLNETNSAQKLFVEVQEPITEQTLHQWLSSESTNAPRRLINLDSLSINVQKARTAITLLSNIDCQLRTHKALGNTPRLKRFNVFIDQIVRDLTSDPDDQGQTITIPAQVTPQDHQTLENFKERWEGLLNLYTRSDLPILPDTVPSWFLVPVLEDPDDQSMTHAAMYSQLCIRPSTYQKILDQEDQIGSFFEHRMNLELWMFGMGESFKYTLSRIPFKQRDAILGQAQELLGPQNGHLLQRILHTLSSLPPQGRLGVIRCAKEILADSGKSVTDRGGVSRNTETNDLPIQTLLIALSQLSPEQRERAVAAFKGLSRLGPTHAHLDYIADKLVTPLATSSLPVPVRKVGIVIDNTVGLPAFLIACSLALSLQSSLFSDVIDKTIGLNTVYYSIVLLAPLIINPLGDFIIQRLNTPSYIALNIVFAAFMIPSIHKSIIENFSGNFLLWTSAIFYGSCYQFMKYKKNNR